MTAAPAFSMRGRRIGAAMAIVWLVFLIWPVRAAWALPAPSRWIALAAITVFAVAYVGVFARTRSMGAFTPDDDGRHDRWGASSTIGPMVVAMLVCAHFIGTQMIGMAIFLVVAGTIELTRVRSAVLAVSMTLVTAVVAVQSDDPGDAILPFLVVISWLSMWISRRIVSDNARLRRAEGELAALSVVAERERVARDVHDILGHTLTVLAIKVQVADRLVDTDPAKAHEELAEIERLTRSALADVRGTVTQLRVPDLAEQVAASQTALRSAGVGLVVRGDAAAVPAERRPLFGWALREATTNIVRHAQASDVEVRITPDRITVTDDGVGMSGRAGNGLTGLTERARAAGAEVTVGPAHPERRTPGTRLEVSYP